MSRLGRWWRAIVAVLLLGGGMLMWLYTGDAPAPWARRGPMDELSAAAAASPPNETPDPVADTAVGEPIEPAPAVPVVAPSRAPTPLSVTDFFAEPPPEPLATALARLKAGVRMSATDVKALMAYDDEHADDPRVQLLFAYDSMKLDWKRAAVGHYVEAYRRDARAREDARMLPDLIAVVGDEREGVLAAEAIAEIFGVDALPSVQDAIDEAADERMAAVAERLAALAERLRRL